MSHTYTIRKGDANGWCYTIFHPGGSVLCEGARLSTKQETEEHCKFLCRKQDNKLGAHWAGYAKYTIKKGKKE